MNDAENKNSESAEALARCAALKDEYLNGWKRAKADLINYQKEESVRFAEIMRLTNESWVAELIPVLQSFDLAIEAAKKSEGDVAGLQGIHGQMIEMFRRQGVSEFSAQPGETFDPAKHESIGETVSAHPPGTIAEVMGSGYKIDGKIVKAATVKISINKDNHNKK